jgi:hypothetical protein
MSTQTWKSGLRLFGFGNKILPEGNSYEKGVVIWREFCSMSDFILHNWGACVDTIFWHESWRLDRQPAKCCAKLMRKLPTASDASDRMKDVANDVVDHCRLITNTDNY